MVWDRCPDEDVISTPCGPSVASLWGWNALCTVHAPPAAAEPGNGHSTVVTESQVNVNARFTCHIRKRT